MPARLRPLLPVTALIAIIWILHRACVQSITLDEANTFRYWVSPGWASHWEPHSNNHVLNSTLMRLSIWLFGLHTLSVRLPAMLGALLYISTIYRLCILLAQGRTLFPWALFLCFVYNPFIMDYLVAARGYGLALGFLSLSMYTLATAIFQDNNRIQSALGMSICSGLAICSNFTFAYAAVFLVVVAGLWMMRRAGDGLWPKARLFMACVAPALIVILILAGSALTRFPRDQLFWGSDSLLQSWREIREASFGELNPYIVNPLLASLLQEFARHWLQALALFGIGYGAMTYAGRRRFSSSPGLVFAACLALVLVLTVSANWLQFKFMKIPLPLERTSIFIVPLATAMLGAALSVDWIHRFVRGFGVAILLLSGLYFTGCLRDSYFRLWRSGADVKDSFPVVVDLCRRTGVREVVTDQNLTGSFNFYRAVDRVEEMDELSNFDTIPPGKTIYVLPEDQYRDFIKQEGLEIAYRGVVSGMIVAYRPVK